MIVLSLLLVLIAAVTLIAGFFQQESLTLIWVSIGSCVGAMVFLAVAMVQRRGRGPATATGPTDQPRAAGSRPTSGAASGSRPGTGVGTAGDGTEPTVRRAVVRRAVVRRRPDEGEGPSSASFPPAAERPGSPTAPAGEDGDAPDPAGATPTAPEASSAPATPAAPTAPTSRPVRPSSRPVSRPSAPSGTGSATPAVTADEAGASGAPDEDPSVTGRDATGGSDRSETETARRVLASIRGVGPAKQEALLAAFGSLEALRGASEQELADVRGIGPRLAATIHRTLHR